MVLKYSTISAATLGVLWSAIHMAYMARSGPDSLGIGAFLMPLSFVAGCIFFFFLLWMPFLLIALIFRPKTVAPHAIRKARIVLILSIVPFLPCLYLFVTAPGMVRYHPFHLSQCHRRGAILSEAMRPPNFYWSEHADRVSVAFCASLTAHRSASRSA